MEDPEPETRALGPPLSPKDYDDAMRKALHPFPNYSTFIFLLHDYDGISKSRENRQRQIQDVFLNPYFRFEEFMGKYRLGNSIVEGLPSNTDKPLRRDQLLS